MANFKEVFGNGHVILPVIHVVTPEQTIENARIVQDAGCDGAFLISMNGLPYQSLLEILRTTKEALPDLWMGVNCLDVASSEVFSIVGCEASGIWTDDVGVDEREEIQGRADYINQGRLKSGWQGLYFGGVAFKHQRLVPAYNLSKVTKLAIPYVDVVTTSGASTGTAADLQKIIHMKHAIGSHPLAIASGISPENVEVYLPYSDAFLVATHILIHGTDNFDPNRVRMLVERVRR